MGIADLLIVLSLVTFTCGQQGYLRFGVLSQEAGQVVFSLVQNSTQTSIQLSYPSLPTPDSFIPFPAGIPFEVTAKTQTNETITAKYTGLVAGSFSSLLLTPASAPKLRRSRTRFQLRQTLNTSQLVLIDEVFPSPLVSAGTSYVRAYNLFPDSAQQMLTFTLYGASNYSFAASVSQASGGYVAIPTGNYTLAGGCPTSSLFSSVQLTVAPGYVYTLVNYGGSFLGSKFCNVGALYADRRASQFRITHASPDAPTVIVSVGSSNSTVSFTQQTPYIPMLVGPTSVRLITLDGKVLKSFSFDFQPPFSSYTVLIYGFLNPAPNTTNALTVSFVYDQQPEAGKGALRLLNLVPDSKSYTAIFGSPPNNQTIKLSYGYNPQTPLIFAAPGTYSLQIFNATSLTRRMRRSLGVSPIFTTTVTLTAGSLTSAMVEGSGSNVQVVVDNSTPNGDSGGLSGGAIAGIVIASIFGAILIAGVFVFFYRRARYTSLP